MFIKLEQNSYFLNRYKKLDVLEILISIQVLLEHKNLNVISFFWQLNQLNLVHELTLYTLTVNLLKLFYSNVLLIKK